MNCTTITVDWVNRPGPVLQTQYNKILIHTCQGFGITCHRFEANKRSILTQKMDYNDKTVKENTLYVHMWKLEVDSLYHSLFLVTGSH